MASTMPVFFLGDFASCTVWARQQCRKDYTAVREYVRSMQIDLNGDVGESFGAYEIGHDAALIPILTSANIACGFHAGDPGVMRATVALARNMERRSELIRVS